MTPIGNVGTNIQRYRKQQMMSLKELAQKAEISSSMLSQLERGLANPSISTLRSIADVLEVPLFKLFYEETLIQEMVVRSDRRKRIANYENDGVTYELLTPDLNGDIEYAMMTLPAHCVSSITLHSHKGEEVAFVEKGTLQVVLEEDSVSLDKGDSIRILPNTMHRWENQSDFEAVVIFAMTPPTF